MSLNMYLKETEVQIRSMNAICTEVIQAMEDTKTSISSFMFAFTLRGKAYDSAKIFMTKTYLPLAQGIIYLCEELMQQNNAYPRDFKSQVAPTDIVEQEILDQMREIEQTIARLRALSDTVPLLSVSITIYEAMKWMLEVKLERLHAFNSSSASNYKTAIQLANEVAKGLRELQNGKGFNKAAGAFSTDRMNLDWATNIDEIHYEKKAYEQYAEYLKQFPNNVDKVVKIIKYEELNTEYVDQTNEFLSPLEERDIVEIQYLMYTAEEPYRTLAIKYLGQFEIASINEGGVFRSNEATITFNVSKDRKNARGKYYTFFHEIGHAIDYYYGIEQGMDGHFSDYFEKLDMNLNNHMYNDVEFHFRKEIAKEIESPEYSNISHTQKKDMINNVTKNIMNQDALYAELSKDEQRLNQKMREHYEELLGGPNNNTASDVYGGVTNYAITGDWGHFDEEGNPTDYWFYDDGERRRQPNREGFAEYYGRIMTGDSDIRTKGIKSIEVFLPASKKYMDDMFNYMSE